MKTKIKPRKTGLFIDKAEDGEWFWTLIARNGNIIAGNYGFNSSQSAIKSIKATGKFFSGKPFMLTIFNKVTGRFII